MTATVMTTLRIRAVTTLRILLLARIRLIRLRAEVVDRQVMIVVESRLQVQSIPRSRLHLLLSVGSNLFVETAFENLERSVMPTENVEIAIRTNTVSTANASRTLRRPQRHPLLAVGSNLFVEMVLLNLERNAMPTAKVEIAIRTNTVSTANASRTLHRPQLHPLLAVGSNLFVEMVLLNLERNAMPTAKVEIVIRTNTVSTANASRTLHRPQLHPLLAVGSNLFVEMVLLNLERNAMPTAKVAIVVTTNTATTANASRSLHRPRQRSQPKDVSIRLHLQQCAAMESGTRMLVKPATRQRILLVATFMSIVMIRVAAIPRVEMVGRTKMRIVTCRLNRSLTRPANLVIRANQTVRARKPRHNRLQESQPKQGSTPLLIPR
jgi:hypothetical protein